VIAVGEAEEVGLVRAQHGRPFDVVVSDVQLPGMSGVELASLMLAVTPSQPIVLMTDDPDQALAREELSRGPVNYVIQPFQLPDLEEAIRSTLVTHFQRKQDPPRTPVTQAPTIGVIPAEWLSWVDERSYAGPGHAQRLASLCEVICAGELAERVNLEDLRMAAYAHELGQLAGAETDALDLAWLGADLLSGLGGSGCVVRIVRHLHERWDGTGGPGRLRGSAIPVGSQVLSVVDAIDHYSAARIQAGLPPVDAVDRALSLLATQRNSVFNPEIVEAAVDERLMIRAICTAPRSAPVPGAGSRSGRPEYPTIARTLLSRLS
ncbi:MAG: HD domain-containing phosphohydrolase, partial [Longimicrobiales bacterium]